VLETLTTYAQAGGLWLAWGMVWLFCAIGMMLSAVGVSGMWLVAVAAAVAAPLSGAGFPGWSTATIFAVVAALVDVVEWFASHWGVRRRGGSRWAGLAAMAGGLLGMIAGSLVFPVIGSLLGMMAGSFGLAYLVERHRLQASSPAAHIATGAVLAVVLVLFLKVTATLLLVGWLVAGVLSG
jgi:uncharacterized protein YqgC (DUF456 family)